MDQGRQFTFGSLFAGIGGLDLGLERAGMVCKWQVEIDDYCLKVLEKHWPHVKRYGDVRECGRHNLEPVDLICGGFPCQDVSSAGKRKGLKEGTRTGLWYEFARIIRELRPRWVLAENVPGLLSVDSGGGMGTVLRDLAESGYDAVWDCIPAAAFGAPHLRYRVFIVAHADCQHLWNESGRRYGESRASKTITAKYGQNGVVADAKRRGRCEGPERVRREARADPGRRSTRADVADTQSQRRTQEREHCKRPSERTPSSSQTLADAQSERTRPTQQSRPRDGAFSGSQAMADANSQRRDWWASIFQAAGSPGRLFAEGGCAWAVEPDVGRVAHGVPSRMDRVRVIGNAVVPQVAEWIGRRILAASEDDLEA